MPEVFGIHVDRLVTLEMKRDGASNRGVILPLYETAFHKQKHPLTLLAAEKLRNAVRAGDYVMICTGSGRPPWRPSGETDGPLGAVSLSRAIKLGLRGRPVYVAAKPYMPPILAASEAAGITPIASKEMAEYDGFYPTALIRDFTLKPDEARSQAKSLMDDLKPAAIIFIENLGPNARGVIHSATGYERESEHVVHTYHLAQEAKLRGILTIGIGDFGNEIGFGLIAEELKQILPCWAKCKCSCGSDPVCHVSTDVLVVGAISNWAGYGIAACLAYLLKNPDLLQSVQTERQMGIDCVYAGAEGEAGMKQPWVDGTSPETQEAIVALLHMLVKNAVTSTLKRGW
jgi:hypothetical protein